MGSHLVVFATELFSDAHQVQSFGDVFAIEALILQCLARPLPHAVLTGSAHSGVTMPQQRMDLAEVFETERANRATVVGHQHDLTNLARDRVGEILVQRTACEALRLGQGQFDSLNPVAVDS